MDKIWLRNYPAGVPAEINPDEVASLQAMLERSFVQFADRPAYTLMDRALAETEAQAILSNIRVSPRKLNLVAE